MTTINDVLNYIRSQALGSTERTLIINAINARTHEARAEAKVGLRPGMRVTFYSRREFRTVVGKVAKVNRVNVDIVEEGNGKRWRASPQLVKPISENPGTGDNNKPVDEGEF